ncbi:MAG TPA: glycosyl transferase, partial [bacterium]|nr:glycosyl transferase [bacterium]
MRFLSNGTYRVLITPAGTGGSSAGAVALTRWNADPVEDPDGLHLFVRDLDRGSCWRIACGTSSDGDAEWRPGRFRIARSCDGVRAEVEICVVPDRAAELRRVRVLNEDDAARRIDVTSF